MVAKALYKYVPQNLVNRPKTGFGVPIDEWLRDPLNKWAKHLLAPEIFTRHGLLQPTPVRRRWQEHKEGRADWEYHLWDVLMLHTTWAEEYN